MTFFPPAPLITFTNQYQGHGLDFKNQVIRGQRSIACPSVVTSWISFRAEKARKKAGQKVTSNGLENEGDYRRKTTEEFVEVFKILLMGNLDLNLGKKRAR